ncbi:uncharacterized protein LOC111335142 [Stylophora pistillata]|uniref:uncharacterized protein LOC111335142 n=1 Tax=Stylophora pistillata TaxID=50429 RepID=UPI000C03AE21|nr:uncharacterized protein LOC111335142 [Stylophora pistillata]
MRRQSLQEAVKMLEDFTIKIQNVIRTIAGKPNVEEVKGAIVSTLKVAAAVEKFALDYGKQHLNDMKLMRIIYTKMVLGIQKVYCQNASDFLFEEERWQTRIDIASSNSEEKGLYELAC